MRRRLAAFVMLAALVTSVPAWAAAAMAHVRPRTSCGVLEIAEHRDVRDEEGIRALFERIGLRDLTPHCLETTAVILAGRQVRREVWRPNR